MIPSEKIRLDLRNKPQNQPIVMYQKWRELLFLHWKVSTDWIQSTLPSGLTVDTYNNDAYLGVVPFLMRDIRPRFFPTVPGISDFLEFNVRTYVFDSKGKPGVWFYSLDASQFLAVKIARYFFKLPYYKATMSSTIVDGYHTYLSKRTDTQECSRFKFKPIEDLEKPNPSSLEFFLIERYLLYAFDASSNKIRCGRVYHEPYPLQSVHLEEIHHPLSNHPIFNSISGPPIHQIYSPGVDVLVYPLTD